MPIRKGSLSHIGQGPVQLEREPAECKEFGFHPARGCFNFVQPGAALMVAGLNLTTGLEPLFENQLQT